MALTPTDNKAKMSAAVARWIAEAETHPNGRRLLTEKATWVARQLRILGDPLVHTPEHLRGLQAVDLIGAESDLRAAARDLKARMKAAA